MITTRRWKILSILILLAGAGWIWVSKAPPGNAVAARPPAPRQGFSAPDFTLQTLDGETVRLSDLRGQPLLINLWASWCPPCKAEMPAFENVYREYKDKGFQILAINATNQDNLNNAINFVQEYKLTFPILLDTNGEVSRQYHLNSLPTSFFVDRNGVIQQVVVGGPMSEALLRIRIEQLLQERP